MDQIKYQVFISSTYTDLQEERKKVLDILLMADCIPAGMENFVATDDEQFNVIKRVIDMCDYYILIIGRRYGSINENTGLSYTEMEYNYAMDKGIPVLVFALDDSVERNCDEEDDIKKGKLAEFKSKAMSNRLANIWSDETDLMGKVSISIMKAKNQIKRPGWRRGKDLILEQLLYENDKLRKENEELRSKFCNKEDSIEDNDKLQNGFYGKVIELHFTEMVMFFTSDTIIGEKTIKVELDQLFKHISLRLTGIKKLSQFKDAISSYVPGYCVDVQDALVVRNKLEQLNLIESYVDKDSLEKIKLTYLGEKIMNELNCD